MKYELIEMPLGGGVNRYTDAPHLAANELLSAVNLRYREPPKLSHRYGHNQHALTEFGGSSVSEARRLISHKDTVLVADADSLYSWSPTGQRLSDRGRLSECSVHRRGLNTNFSNDPIDPAVAYGNGYFVYAWHGTGNTPVTHVVVVDEKSDVIVSAQTLSVSSMLTPRLFVCGNTCWLLYGDILNSRIRYATMDLAGTTLAFSATAALATSVLTVGFSASTFDASAISSTVFVVAYHDSATNDVIVDTFSQTPAVVNSATINTASAPQVIAVEGLSTDGIWVAWADTAAGLSCTAFTPALVVNSTDLLSATVVTASRAGIVRVSQTIRLIVWEEPPAGGNRASTWWITKTSGGGVGTPGSAFDLVPVSKPFTYTTSQSTSQFVMVSFESSLQGTFYLLEIYRGGTVVGTGRWVATAARGIGRTTDYTGYLSSTATSTAETTKVYIPAAIKKRFLAFGGEDQTKIFARTRIDAITFDFDEDKLHNAVSWGDGLFICGGRPGWYDGVRVIEHGWAWSPEFMTVSIQNTASGALTAADYGWSVIYGDEDANGYVSWSSPFSGSTTVVGAGIDTIRYVWDQGMLLTTREATFRTFVYRTLANEPEPQFSIDGNGTGFSAVVGTTVNATSADSVVEDFDVCYTTGGILDSAGTPPCDFAVAHGERLWLGGTEDPEFIWFSQPFVEREQPRFNEALRVNIGAPVRAMASMDGQLIVWSDGAIYAVAGDGPPATGGVDIGFGVRKISTDVGCIDWRSVVLSPVGLFFQSRKGIYLLDRGLNTSFVGAPVDDYISSRIEIIAALAEEETPTVMFLLQVTGGGTVSVRLVYDYQVKAWTVDSLPFVAVDMKMVYDGIQGKRVPALLSETHLWFEDSDVYTDGIDGTPVDTEVAYADLKLSGAVQGWERVRMAQILWGTQLGSASIFVDFSYDYGNSYDETHTFTIAEQQVAGTRMEVHLNRQECQAVRMRIREKNEGNIGVQYRSVVFEGGIMPGPKQLNAATQRK